MRILITHLKKYFDAHATVFAQIGEEAQRLANL
jgi:hypothetical protein